MGMMGGRSLRRPKGAALWNPASRRCTERTGDRARSGEPYRGQGFVPPRGRNAAQARLTAASIAPRPLLFAATPIWIC